MSQRGNYRRSVLAASGGPYTTVATGLTGTTYADTGLTDGAPLYYLVTSVNAVGESGTTDEAMACPLAPASADAATPAYGYTGDGLRAWKGATASARTYFLHDGSSPVCEMDATGAVTAVNTFGATGLLSRHTPTSGSTFYAFDPQGNVSERLNGAGQVLGQYAFDAFGARQGTDASADPFSGFGGQWGYYRDAETGLSLLTHRYYDPGTGRFVTRDPTGYGGGINLYAYTANNPVNETDSTGYGLDELMEAAQNLPPGPRTVAAAGLTVVIVGVAAYNSLHDHPVSWPRWNPAWTPPFLRAAPKTCPVTENRRGSKPVAKLRHEWEQENNQPWPTLPDGRRYVAEHKIPLGDGGEDNGKNIEPLTPEEHTQQHKDRGDYKRWGGRRN